MTTLTQEKQAPKWLIKIYVLHEILTATDYNSKSIQKLQKSFWAEKVKRCNTINLYKPLNFLCSPIISCDVLQFYLYLVNLCPKRESTRLYIWVGEGNHSLEDVMRKSQANRWLMNILIRVLSWRKLPMPDDTSAQKRKNAPFIITIVKLLRPAQMVNLYKKEGLLSLNLLPTQRLPSCGNCERMDVVVSVLERFLWEGLQGRGGVL